ncbi:asparagine synthase (glutamine-hydrolyzing) [Gammaproteobacteria bacterium 42_54_T18]|nr:asparagine synthase (glutamine-hydrolyzing) [Gammaproteobacteria bacterium 42_54_T18]
MCGIAGVVGYEAGNASESTARTMIETFGYRGPDDSGTWKAPNDPVALGHMRLSIIDTSHAGHQPMLSFTDSKEQVDADYSIVFNGEIFNYIEVREELKSEGVVFNTESDTEVILKAYKFYGRSCLDKFNGMFAIAIWDVAAKELFIARDRLGIKPFYYYLSESGDFYFASEVKAILAVVDKTWETKLSLIDQYMSFGYVPGEDTLHDGVKRLLPGYSAIYSKSGLEIEQYWDITFNDGSEDKGLSYYAKETEKLIKSAIDLRLRSDVPLGIFLSGGIDSSAVVALLSEKTDARLNTFSVGYDFGEQFDESHYARLVSKEFNTNHHEIKVDPKEFKVFIDHYIDLMDEPVTEAAAISLHYVSQLAKENVTVVLSGEGSDEIFGGYDFYQYMTFIEKIRAVIGGSIADILAVVGNKISKISPKISKYLVLTGQTFEQRYRGISSYGDTYKKILYKRNVKEVLAKKKNTGVSAYLQMLFNKTKGLDVLSRMLYFDTKTWLVDDLLIKADRMSMASSLELRVPFLDYRLVEFAATIPSHYKINKGTSKFILKHIMKDYLPDEIINRKKMGFPTPLKMMFQNELSEYAHDVLLAKDACIAEIFVRSAIDSLLNDHYHDKADNHRVLWQLIVLERWLKKNNVVISLDG